MDEQHLLIERDERSPSLFEVADLHLVRSDGTRERIATVATEDYDTSEEAILEDPVWDAVLNTAAFFVGPIVVRTDAGGEWLHEV